MGNRLEFLKMNLRQKYSKNEGWLWKLKWEIGNSFRTVLFTSVGVVGCGGCLTVKN